MPKVKKSQKELKKEWESVPGQKEAYEASVEKTRAETKATGKSTVQRDMEAKANIPITPTAPIPETPIKLERKKTGIEAYREKDTLGGKAVKVLSSPKTTLALGGILAAELGGAAIAGRMGTMAFGAEETAVITRTATTLGKYPITKTAQRAFIGKSGKAATDVLFKFSTNQKSIGLTKSLLTKTFSTIKNPAFIIGAIGSYPFASFIKEEALQTLSIPIYQALKEGDVETARTQIAEVDKMIAEKNNLLDKIPYANVLKRLNEFFNAAQNSNNAWKSIISKAEEQAQIESEKPTFAEERATADEEARQRDLKEMQWKNEYYALIREGKFDEADELLKQQE